MFKTLLQVCKILYQKVLKRNRDLHTQYTEEPLTICRHGLQLQTRLLFLHHQLALLQLEINNGINNKCITKLCQIPQAVHSYRSQKRQNVTRTSVLHLAAPPVPPFCSYHILMSSVTYKGHMTTWNLFGKEIQTLKKTVLWNCTLFFTLILHILLGYSTLKLLFKFQILNCWIQLIKLIYAL